MTAGSGEGVDLRRDIFPVLIVTGPTEDPDIKAFMGTGFVLHKNVFVTCHHCVAAPLEKGDRYVVALPIEWVSAPPDRNWAGPYGIADLSNIEQHPGGIDLATATLPFSSAYLGLAGVGLSVSDEVFAYGYPLTQDSPHPVAGRSLTIFGRYLQGYCTTIYANDVPDYAQTPSYELDMPAPRGLSGAPVIKRGTPEVVGVVYGTKDTGTVEEFSRVDEATGTRTPELQRVTTFAVAHMFDSLHDLSGSATDSRPLGEYLSS
jgi:V8-like Glu-specific endopeptidase